MPFEKLLMFNKIGLLHIPKRYYLVEFDGFLAAIAFENVHENGFWFILFLESKREAFF